MPKPAEAPNPESVVLIQTGNEDDIFKDVGQTPQKDTPLEKLVQGDNGYTFLRNSTSTGHLIYITNEAKKFSWTVGIDDRGATFATILDNTAPIHGYYTISCNGTMGDMREALASTGRFFPRLGGDPMPKSAPTALFSPGAVAASSSGSELRRSRSLEDKTAASGATSATEIAEERSAKRSRTKNGV